MTGSEPTQRRPVTSDSFSFPNPLAPSGAVDLFWAAVNQISDQMHFDHIFWLRLLQLGGLTLLAMGIWVSVDGGSFLQLLGPFARQGMQFVNVGFFCIAIGAALVLLGLLGCCGAHKESKCLLLMVGTPDLVRGGPGLPSWWQTRICTPVSPDQL